MKDLLRYVIFLTTYAILPSLLIFLTIPWLSEHEKSFSSNVIGDFIIFITVHYPLFGAFLMAALVAILVSLIEQATGKDFKYLNLPIDDED